MHQHHRRDRRRHLHRHDDLQRGEPVQEEQRAGLHGGLGVPDRQLRRRDLLRERELRTLPVLRAQRERDLLEHQQRLPRHQLGAGVRRDLDLQWRRGVQEAGWSDLRRCGRVLQPELHRRGVLQRGLSRHLHGLQRWWLSGHLLEHPREGIDGNATITCTGNNACDGAGVCKLKNGQSCAGGASTCASGLCADRRLLQHRLQRALRGLHRRESRAAGSPGGLWAHRFRDRSRRRVPGALTCNGAGMCSP